MQVWKSETVMNNLSPTWKPAKVSLQTLCNGDRERPIKISCYDWDRDGSHDFIGEFTTSVSQLVASRGNAIAVINPKKAKKKGKKSVMSGSQEY